MKKTQLKDALRNIWKQRVSYLSIIVIAFLGVTTFLGIDYSDGALRRNGSSMYNAVNFRDIEIVSTMLLTGEDLDVIGSTEGVTDAEAVWLTDAKVSAGDDRQDVQVISLTDRINLPELVEGRLPETAEECVVESGLAEEMGWKLGDAVEAMNAKGETAPYLLGGRFVITGIANHPDHTSVSIPDTLYVMVTRDAFDMDALDGCCMKAEVVIEKPADMDRFSEGYDDAVASVSARLEKLADTRAGLRDEEVRQQYQSEIDEGKAALDEGGEELDEARAELDDGWSALAEAQQEIADGEDQLSDASQQLEEGRQQLLDAEAQLEEAEAGLATAKAQLDSGYDELCYMLDQLASGRYMLEDGWEELEDAKAQVRGAIRVEIEALYGGDTSEIISWASRIPADVDGGTVSATDFWITDSFKVDLDKSLDEIILDFLYSGKIPDELLIAAYENLLGGAG